MRPLIVLALLSVFISVGSSLVQQHSLRLVETPFKYKLEHVERLKSLDFKNAKKSSSSRPLTDYSSDFYLVNISIGTPPQSFLVVPSTFTADFWIIDSNCEDDECIGSAYKKNRFDKSKSKTYVESEDQIESEAFVANIAKDVLQLDSLVARDQTFALAYEIAPELGDYPLDGYFGLGGPGLSQLGPAKTPLQSLVPSMSEPVFTIWLKSRKNITNPENGGAITFGAQDTTNCESNWAYANLSGIPDIWQFRVDSFSVGKFGNHRRRPAVMYPNFAGILGPTGNVANIMKSIDAISNEDYQVYTVNCDATDLPDLKFKVGGAELSIPSSEYVLDVSSEIDLGDNTCAVMIFGFENQQGGPAWYLGNPFLRSYCSLFDIGKQRMGFAKAKQSA